MIFINSFELMYTLMYNNIVYFRCFCHCRVSAVSNIALQTEVHFLYSLTLKNIKFKE